VEIREMFFEDFSITYSFGATDEERLTPTERAESLLFA
jgi:hypothetical protein